MECPQVLTFHDAVPLMHPEYAPRSFAVYFKRLMPKVVKRADAIICNSENTRKDLLEHFPADPELVHVTYLGVDPVEVDRRGTFSHLEPYMLAMSNTKMKNLDFTMDEFIRYKDSRGGDLRLVVAGTDHTGRSEDRKDVEVLDYLERERFLELMAGAEALLFPSHYEGFGFPPLEAMTLGVPTIVSDRGSLPEVVGDASLVVDIDRAGSMAEAMERLHTEEGLADELRRKGLERYKGFTWDETARGTIAVYEGLVG
jgi:glycosyltransferase involved in cell wall biosynthesis